MIEIEEDTGFIRLLKDSEDISLLEIYHVIVPPRNSKYFKPNTSSTSLSAVLRKIRALFTRHSEEELAALEDVFSKVSLQQVCKGI